MGERGGGKKAVEGEAEEEERGAAESCREAAMGGGDGEGTEAGAEAKASSCSNKAGARGEMMDVMPDPPREVQHIAEGEGLRGVVAAGGRGRHRGREVGEGNGAEGGTEAEERRNTMEGCRTAAAGHGDCEGGETGALAEEGETDVERTVRRQPMEGLDEKHIAVVVAEVGGEARRTGAKTVRRDVRECRQTRALEKLYAGRVMVSNVDPKVQQGVVGTGGEGESEGQRRGGGLGGEKGGGRGWKGSGAGRKRGGAADAEGSRGEMAASGRGGEGGRESRGERGGGSGEDGEFVGGGEGGRRRR